MSTNKNKIKLVMIAAMCSQTRSIGNHDGTFPWDRIKGDFRHFKKTTMGLDDSGEVREENGHPMIMGRKTFESFNGRIPPGRPFIIMSRYKKDKPKYEPKGFTEGSKYCVVHSIYDAKKKAMEYEKDAGREKNPKAFVIGGGEIYERFLQHANELILSFITPKKGEIIETPIKFPKFRREGFKKSSPTFEIEDPLYEVKVKIFEC
jgi:dihydrofolate reductase